MYTGDEITPAIVVTDDGKTLTEGVDYEVAFENNVNVGTAKVIVTFIGNYTGTAEKTFEITAKKNDFDVTESRNSFVYNKGKVQKPTITVKDNGKTLNENTDYVLEFSNENSENAGVYTITIYGTGNYTGPLGKINYVIASQVVNATFEESEITKTFGDEDFVNSLTISGNSGIITFRSSNTSVATVDENGKVSIIGAGTTIISVFTEATDNYQSASALYILTVNPKGVDGATFKVLPIDNQIYTGKELKPDVIVKDGETVLVENVDYVLTYTNNTAVGTAEVVVKGIGNYSGEINTTFGIVANASAFTASEIEDVIYTGEEIKPEPTVSYGGKTLTKGTDYTISYENNVEVGTAFAIIKGIGAYEGLTLKIPFNILSASKISKTLLYIIPAIIIAAAGLVGGALIAKGKKKKDE